MSAEQLDAFALAGAPAAFELPDLDGELWLQKRLRSHGVDVFAGATDPGIRRDRFRELIKQHGLEQAVCGRKDGKCLTYAAAWQRLYGCKF